MCLTMTVTSYNLCESWFCRCWRTFQLGVVATTQALKKSNAYRVINEVCILWYRNVHGYVSWQTFKLSSTLFDNRYVTNKIVRILSIQKHFMLQLKVTTSLHGRELVSYSQSSIKYSNCQLCFVIGVKWIAIENNLKYKTKWFIKIM